MGELKPEPGRPAEPNPRVVPLGAARPQASRGEPDPGVSQRVFAIVVGLLVVAGLALIVQTQRVSNKTEQIAVLEGQVEELSTQLAAANTQIATYDRQMSLIRTAVASITDQMSNLSELLGATTAPAQPPVVPPERPTAP